MKNCLSKKEAKQKGKFTKSAISMFVNKILIMLKELLLATVHVVVIQ